MASDRGDSGSDRDDPPSGRPLAPQRRRTRRRRILAWTSAIVTVILAAGAVTLYVGYRHLNRNIHVRDIRRLVGVQPMDLHPRAENIAIIGSDSRAGTHGQYGSPRVYAAGHSDTLMILHIAADRKWAEVVSIPRDSWVHIPSCDMGNGRRSPPANFKINAAFTLGSMHGDQASGAACTIRTVERNTGLRIHHFAVINFAGFNDMVNALGGVEVCTRHRIADPKAKLYLPAGHHMLMGRQALAYVRARYTLGNGSDLERITRQQAFMSSLATRAKSELYNPISIYRFLDAATKSLTIDSGLGGIAGLYSLAHTVKNLPTSNLRFITIPTYPRSLAVPSDTANVMWKQPETRDLFKSLREDIPWQPGASQTQAAAATISPEPSAPPGPAVAATPRPSATVAGRSANQNICT